MQIPWKFSTFVFFATTNYFFPRFLSLFRWKSYIHTYIQTYIHTYMHTYIYTFILTYINTYIYTFICKYMLTILILYYINAYSDLTFCFFLNCFFFVLLQNSRSQRQAQMQCAACNIIQCASKRIAGAIKQGQRVRKRIPISNIRMSTIH